jgi:hypothetical protein
MGVWSMKEVANGHETMRQAGLPAALAPQARCRRE